MTDTTEEDAGEEVQSNLEDIKDLIGDYILIPSDTEDFNEAVREEMPDVDWDEHEGDAESLINSYPDDDSDSTPAEEFLAYCERLLMFGWDSMSGGSPDEYYVFAPSVFGQRFYLQRPGDGDVRLIAACWPDDNEDENIPERLGENDSDQDNKPYKGYKADFDFLRVLCGTKGKVFDTDVSGYPPYYMSSVLSNDDLATVLCLLFDASSAQGNNPWGRLEEKYEAWDEPYPDDDDHKAVLRYIERAK